MKVRLFLIIFLSFLSVSAFAQTNWEKLCQENPHIALEKAKQLYYTAVLEKNFPEIIQSLIIQIRCKTLIDASAMPGILRDLEGLIRKSKDTLEKSVLHSLAAELYEEYYQQNSYRINQRTALSEYIPEDPEEWSSNLFIEKIFSHALSSLQHPSLLATTDIKRYQLLLLKGSDSPTLRPTFLDFLSHRSIQQLSFLRRTQIDSYFQQYPLDTLLAFTPLEDFVRTPFSPRPYDINSHILKIYQDLLSFRSTNPNRPARLIADLDRYRYAYENSQDFPLYQAALERLDSAYKDIPYVVEVWADKASLYYTQGYKRLKTDSSLLYKARNLCKTGIKTYPRYPRINLLKQICQEIEKPRLSFNYPSTVYPSDTLAVKVGFYHVKNMQIKICRTHTTAPKEHSVIYQKTYTLQPLLLQQDTVFYFPIKKAGSYEISFSSPQLDTLRSDFVCTQLYTVYKTNKDTIRFVVRDAVSGKPVRNATIEIQKEKTRNKPADTSRIYTNQYGMAAFILPKKKFNYYSFHYQVTNAQNPASERNSYYYEGESQILQEQSIRLFTDRKIYRPGQTVYYSGIAWTTTHEKSYLNTGETWEVKFYDANKQLLASQNKTTNEWGTFTGKFTIPKETLNGSFLLKTGRTRQYIEVADYKRPETEILLFPPDEAYAFGDSVQVLGQVKTYAGIPVPHTPVSYQIYLYDFYSWNENGKSVITGKTGTDAKGAFSISFKTLPPTEDRASYNKRYYYQITAEVSTAKGETQEASTRVAISQQAYYFQLFLAKNIDKNNPTPIRVRTINSNQQKISKNIRYRIYSLFSPKQPLNLNETDSLPIDKLWLEGELNTVRDSLLPSFHHWPSGAYLFQVEGRTKQGKKLTEQKIFYLYSLQDKEPPVLTYNWFLPLKTHCHPGEEAEIWLGTSAEETYVLYELYHQKQLIERKQCKINKGITKFTIPYKTGYGPEIYLNLSFVKNQEFFDNNIRLYQILPDKKLKVKTKIFRDKLQPGQQERWELSITDYAGKPVQSETMAVMYDRALDNLMPNLWHFSPSPFLPFNYSNWNAYPFQFEYNRYLYNRKNQKYSTVPPFRFDRLNLYGLGIHISPQLYKASSRVYTEASANFEEAISVDVSNFDVPQNTTADAETATEEASLPLSPHTLRSNFAETAFFYPQLVSNEQGEVSFTFTAPEAITSWKFMALTHTRDLDYGYIEREVITLRDFTITPYIPRFFRSGDNVVLKAGIHNQSNSRQTGGAVLELFEPLHQKVIFKQTVPFETNPDATSTVSFHFTVPTKTDIIGCRITAQTDSFSDGEQHLVAIAPNEIMLTEALSIFSNKAGKHVFTLKPESRERTDYRLTLELTANPIWYAVLALPGLQQPRTENVTDLSAAFYVNAVASFLAKSNPRITAAIKAWDISATDPALSSPLQQNEELKSVLLQVSPWVTEAQNESEQRRSLQQLFDKNQLDYLQKNTLRKLLELQEADGGWSWFKGMKSNRFITANVLTIFALANLVAETEYGETEKEMQMKALRFLDKSIQKDYENQKKTNYIGYNQIIYLYVRSFYLDIPLGDALPAHKHYIALMQEKWKQFSLYEKALSASTLFRYGARETSRQILRSLEGYASISPELGMYWANNTASPYSQSDITDHVAIMEAFHEIQGNTPQTDLMKQWLLSQKQTRSWGAVPSTVNAIYALLLTGNKLLDEKEELTVALGKQEITAEATGQNLGYIKTSYPASRFNTEMETVELTKQNNTPTWGALYLQYYAPLARIEKAQNQVLQIEKKLFIEKNTDTGQELVPLNREIKTGDKLMVRLTISTKRNLEFVHLQDLRAACLEPVEQISGTYWKYGTFYYQETQDASTNFFISHLPKGTYVFEYPVWVNLSGEYQDGIATVQCLYAPQFVAHSRAGKIKVE